MTTDQGELSRFQVLAPLAQGSMAEVYLCRLQGVAGFEKQVALKRLRPVHADNPVAVRMFLDEARVAAQLSHANIAQVFEVGEQDGVPYLAMEYVRGVPLSLVIARAVTQGQLHYGHAARIVGGIAEALAYAYGAVDNDGHPLEVIHRDVCPANIMVSFDGTPKLLDFGLASRSGPLTLDQAAEVFRGDLRYMAPEQISVLPVDHRADVFSLGVVLAELTTGVNPFGTATQRPTEVLHMTTRGEYVRPTALVADYPPELERIVVAALERDPEDRCWSTRELRERLEVFVTTSGHGFSPRGLAAWMRDLFPELVPVMRTPSTGSAATGTPEVRPREAAPGWEQGETPAVQVQVAGAAGGAAGDLGSDARPADYEELTETKAEAPGAANRVARGAGGPPEIQDGAGENREQHPRGEPREEAREERWAGPPVLGAATSATSATVPPPPIGNPLPLPVPGRGPRGRRVATLMVAGTLAAVAGWGLVRAISPPLPARRTIVAKDEAGVSSGQVARVAGDAGADPTAAGGTGSGAVAAAGRPIFEPLPPPAGPPRPAPNPAGVGNGPGSAVAAAPAPGPRKRLRRSTAGGTGRLARGRGRPRRQALVVPARAARASATGGGAAAGPAGGTAVPAKGIPAPAGGAPAPAGGPGAPAGGTPALAGGTAAPAGGAPAPAGGTTASAGGTTASAGGSPGSVASKTGANPGAPGGTGAPAPAPAAVSAPGAKAPAAAARPGAGEPARIFSVVPRSPVPLPSLPRVLAVKDQAQLGRVCQAVEALAVSLAGVSPDFARGITGRMRRQVPAGQAVYPIAMYYFIVREALLKRDSLTAAGNLASAHSSGLILQLKDLPGHDKPLP